MQRLTEGVMIWQLPMQHILGMFYFRKQQFIVIRRAELLDMGDKGGEVIRWFCLVLWYIKHFRLFYSKSIFIQINSSISNNSVKHKYTVQLSKTFLFQAIQFSQTVLIKTIQFSISIVFVYTQLKVKTFLFQTIQFNIAMQFKCQNISFLNTSV